MMAQPPHFSRYRIMKIRTKVSIEGNFEKEAISYDSKVVAKEKSDEEYYPEDDRQG